MDSTTETVINEIREIAAELGLGMHPKEWGIAAQIQHNIMLKRQDERNAEMVRNLIALTDTFLEKSKPVTTEDLDSETENQVVIDSPEDTNTGTNDTTAESDRIWFNPANLAAQE